MRHRSFIAAASLLMLLIFGAVAVYALAASGDDEIADGVTVGGVDVGGMKRGEARDAVAQRVQEPLSQPLTVRYGSRRFVLSGRAARARADVDGMVDDALAASRKGNMLSRAARNVTGGHVNAEIPVRVDYDHDAVDRLVKRVRHGVNRQASDAKVDFSAGSLDKVAGRGGIAVRADALRESVGDELTHPTPARLVKARVAKTAPQVGIDDLAGKYPTVVAVDRGAFTLRVYKHLKLAQSYRVAVGQQGLETPAGLYHVQNKAIDPAWHVPHSPWAGKLAGRVIPGGAPDNPLKARWLGIYDGAGIHGTSELGSLGSAASHGCIRMAVPDVMKVYDAVPVGAPVYIA